MNTQSKITTFIVDSKEESIEFLENHLYRRSSEEVNPAYDRGFTEGVRIMVDLLMDIPYRDVDQELENIIEKVLEK